MPEVEEFKAEFLIEARQAETVLDQLRATHELERQRSGCKRLGDLGEALETIPQTTKKRACGQAFLPLTRMERYIYVLSDGSMCLCGVSIKSFEVMTQQKAWHYERC